MDDTDKQPDNTPQRPQRLSEEQRQYIESLRYNMKIDGWKVGAKVNDSCIQFGCLNKPYPFCKEHKPADPIQPTLLV